MYRVRSCQLLPAHTSNGMVVRITVSNVLSLCRLYGKQQAESLGEWSQSTLLVLVPPYGVSRVLSPVLSYSLPGNKKRLKWNPVSPLKGWHHISVATFTVWTMSHHATAVLSLKFIWCSATTDISGWHSCMCSTHSLHLVSMVRQHKLVYYVWGNEHITQIHILST
jgi:hypothetical protein